MRAFTWSADLSKREGFNRRQAPLIAKHGSNPISDMDKMFHHIMTCRRTRFSSVSGGVKSAPALHLV